MIQLPDVAALIMKRLVYAIVALLMVAGQNGSGIECLVFAQEKHLNPARPVVVKESGWTVPGLDQSQMKGLAFGVRLLTLVSFSIQTASSNEFATPAQNATGLKLSVVADKHSYKQNDEIILDVKLINTNGVQDVFVYGTLEFGLRASLTLFLHDANGKDVPSRFFPDAWELPPDRNDKTAFVKLLPDHFLGTFSRLSIQTLGIKKPGKYILWAEYHCPVSVANVEVSPFWSKESGTIKSNVVQINVLP